MSVDETVVKSLVDLLTGKADEILRDADRLMDRSHVTHYEKAGPRVTHERLKHLYDLVVWAIAERQLEAVRAHAEEVAHQRFTAGFDLSEVQRAYNVLEEAIWNRVLQATPPSQLASALGLVSTVLGAGKDRLAQTYVSLASSVKAPSLDLQALFRGTSGI